MVRLSSAMLRLSIALFQSIVPHTEQQNTLLHLLKRREEAANVLVTAAGWVMNESFLSFIKGIVKHLF